ncbi:ASCH domain-containing protein [Chryseobacterium paridis]|uniref:ASCH domain-containing protein n=1 Tax=Chryseobacterium paridis TaxID=2800328 RepID=A0ABS1FYF0_9FLAO|nr:ASCH domain-containing protein [Chryseobacterium paridis]MBK1897243.1 ASCH domain-containing protein [Chryseobacterium paridis]
MPLDYIASYWNQFIDSLKEKSSPDLELCGSFHFGGKEDASSIAKLVTAGIKTATGSLLWVYESENNPIPSIGEFNIITDSNEMPVCVIQTKEISIVPFKEVGTKFAFDSGEGDRTLESWREIYWEYIQSECERINKEPTMETPLVCEYFKVVYAEPFQF